MASTDSQKPELSVVLVTYNPRRDILKQVLDALEHQSLPKSRWEFVVVDQHEQIRTRRQHRAPVRGHLALLRLLHDARDDDGLFVGISMVFGLRRPRCRGRRQPFPPE